MDRPFHCRRWMQAIGIAALLLIVGPEVSAAIWHARHAAPLGRSTEAVDRTLARLLPISRSLDSAVAVLRAAGVDMRPVEPGVLICNATRQPPSESRESCPA